MLPLHCTNFPDIAQEKSRGNNKQKDKTVRNKAMTVIFSAKQFQQGRAPQTVLHLLERRNNGAR